MCHQVSWTKASPVLPPSYRLRARRRAKPRLELRGVGTKFCPCSAAVRRTLCQTRRVTEQVASKCSAVFGSLKHKTQVTLCGILFLLRQSAVWHLPRMASHENNLHLRGASVCQIILLPRRGSGSSPQIEAGMQMQPSIDHQKSLQQKTAMPTARSCRVRSRMPSAYAVGLGAVGVIGRRVRAKYRRVRLCRRLRLTRRPRNAVGSGQFQFFLKNSKFWKKNQKNYYFVIISFLLIFPFFLTFLLSL
jgi:hypothetical protein